MTRPKPHETPERSAPADAIPDHVLDQVVMWLVTMRSRSDVLRLCLAHPTYRLTEPQAWSAISEASRRISVAAAVEFDQELGQALLRLDDLYQVAIVQKDPRLALNVLRERAKVLGLNRGGPAGQLPPGPAGDEAEVEALQELNNVRDRLASLLPTTPDEPTDELARRVVALVVSLQSAASS